MHDDQELNHDELLARIRQLRGELAGCVDRIPFLYSAAVARELRRQVEAVELELDALIRSLDFAGG